MPFFVAALASLAQALPLQDVIGHPYEHRDQRAQTDDTMNSVAAGSTAPTVQATQYACASLSSAALTRS